MKAFLWIVLKISLILTASALKKPNIVFCLIDDLGWNDVSFHGSRQIPTPNIDALAANSIILHNYYTQPLCTPSRASLMTGDHPIHSGLQNWVILSPQPSALSLNYTILPQHMKKLGYRADAIGKWHLGFYHGKYTPIQRGFDSYFGYWTPKMDYYNHVDEDQYESLGDLWGTALREGMRCADEYNGTYATHLFTDRAVDIIRKHDDKQPLFLYLSHLAVHGANSYEIYQAPTEYVNQFPHINDPTRRTFAGMVSAMDESVGKVFTALYEKGMLNNTIFIVSTDNGGESAGFRGGVGSNWPLRGNKGTTWEAGVRGTAFVWSPYIIEKSPRISTQLMTIQDWLPTLYSAAGGNPDDLQIRYGKSLWEALKGDTPSPRTELLHNIDPMFNVQTARKGDYKLVIENFLDNKYDGWYGASGRDNERISEEEYRKKVDDCVVTNLLKRMGKYVEMPEEWKRMLNLTCNHPHNYTRNCYSRDTACLFDVANDPCETNNAAAEHPEVVADMLHLIDEYNKTAVPLTNRTIDPKADPANYGHHWVSWEDYPLSTTPQEYCEMKP